MTQRKTISELVEEARKVHGDYYDFSRSTYVSAHTKLEVVCPKHGIFKIAPHELLRGQGCKYCGIERRTENAKLKLDDFVSRSTIIHNGKYEYHLVELEEYKKDVKIICPIHGKFWQMPNAHLNGEGCPKCANIGSKYEDEISNSLSEIEIQQRNRKLLNGKEIDIYLPRYKFGIEFNCLYWHSEENGKDKEYHLNKLNMCNENGIELIQIFEDEWISKREICESIIKNEIALNINEILCADNCNITEIDNIKETSEFLDKNSIYGIDECHDIAISAYSQGNIVGVMTFKKDNENEYTLNRITTNIKYNCVALKEKMFVYFKEQYKPNRVVYFADRRWITHINDNIYTKLGFKVDSFTEPIFEYYKKNTRFGRIKQDKVTDVNGYTRIWNCGQVKYVYTK